MSESLRTLLIATILLLCVVVGWFFLLFHPQNAKLASLRQRTDGVLANIQSFRTTSQQVAQLDEKISLLQKQLTVASARLVTKPGLSQAVKRIVQEGKKYGLGFDKIIPDYASLVTPGNASATTAPTMKLTLHIKLRGRYKSFGRFLENLDNLPFAVSLGEISLAYDESISPQLEILMDAILFLRNDDGTKS